MIKPINTILFIFILGCSSPFEIQETEFVETLIVEGVITNEFKTQIVELKVTIPLDTVVQTNLFNPVSGAEMVIVENDDIEYILTEVSPGIYHSDPFAGRVGKAYQLTGETADGQFFRSEKIIHRANNSIESINSTYISDDERSGVKIEVVTGDENEVEFYRWEWEETIQVNSPTPSDLNFDLETSSIFRRTVNVDSCWKMYPNETILIETTLFQSSNKIDGLEIKFIPNEGIELQKRYSLLVKQYSISSRGFNYWNTLKSFDLNLGSLADTQPGEVIGNIISDDSQSILGFFDASDVYEKRIFLTPEEFEIDGYSKANLLGSCSSLSRVILEPEILPFLRANFGWVIFFETDMPTGYRVIPQSCGDCTVFGTNERPNYW